ncbi:MAG: hypothetical protein QOE56_2381 [Solirubrobacterales bacterium]|nr:hypothetical protein [Solirubrobacterales bacterium]
MSTKRTSVMSPASTWRSGIGYHVGIEVPDMEQARDFYCGILGFEEVWKLEAEGPWLEGLAQLEGAQLETVQLVVPGGSRIELQQYKPQGTVGEAKVFNQGLNHLSFGVDDIQAAYDGVVSAGIKTLCEPTPLDFGDEHPMTGWSVFYFEDPWGLSLEMVGPTPGASQDFDEAPSR